jgi:hypothetical protein
MTDACPGKQRKPRLLLAAAAVPVFVVAVVDALIESTEAPRLGQTPYV